MTNSEKLALMETRLKKLKNKPVNIVKSTGVIRKLTRQIRKYEQNK